MTLRIGIIGAGLIGASCARALKASDDALMIFAYDTDADTLDWLRHEAVIDATSTTLEQFLLHQPDIIIIATPPSHWQQIAQELADHALDAVQLIMDVGSVKAYAIECFGALPHYVPAHPIAGSDQAGARHSNELLFQHKRIILTPTDTTDARAIALATYLWEAMGSGDVHTMPHTEHDRVYAFVSHLPQLVAYAVAHAMLDQVRLDATMVQFLRLAGSSPALWVSIMMHNPHLNDAGEMFLRILSHMIAELSGGAPQDAAPADMQIAASLCPRIIAACLVSAVTVEEHRSNQKMIRYAGTGFADMSAPAMSEPEGDLERISLHCHGVIVHLQAIDASMRALLIALKQGEAEVLLHMMQEAQQRYRTELAHSTHTVH
jgi:prephenate dehydrogenase